MSSMETLTPGTHQDLPRGQENPGNTNDGTRKPARSPIWKSPVNLIPDELCVLPQWVAWQRENRDGKETKVPMSPVTGGRASTTDEATWGTYVAAYAYAKRAGLAGVGFVFKEGKGYVGVDLDHVRNPDTGIIEPWAMEIVNRLESYTEVSQSGTGLHIILKGALPPGKRRRGQVEIYDQGRYFVMTGDHLEGTPFDVHERQEALSSVYTEFLTDPGSSTITAQQGDTRKPVLPFDDATLLAKAMQATNGSKFTQLWRGDCSAYPSASEADLALCSLLSFWTGRDAARVDRLFRQSGLMRPKWDEVHGNETYGKTTIAKALENSDTYSGSPVLPEGGLTSQGKGHAGSRADLDGKPGDKVLHRCSGSGGDTHPTCTVESYAEAKHLPIEFLQGLGIETVHLKGRSAVKMPYLDGDGIEQAVRFCFSLSGENRLRWRSKSKILPYGLWRLAQAREAGYVILVEEESDAQTLWYHGLPALGIPGSSAFKPEWAEPLAGLTVYLWQKSDDSDQVLLQKLGKTLPDIRVMAAPEERKDVSACHVLGDNVRARMQTLMVQARLYSQMQAEQLNQQAEEVKQQAGELLNCPNILDAFGTLCEQLGLVGEDRNAKLLYLTHTSRLLNRPVSVCVKGPSSGGKSFTVETVLKAFPESCYLTFTAMSEHALVYDERPIQHKHIVLFEASGLGQDRPGESNDFAYMVRSLLSEGCIKYVTVEKTADGLQSRAIDRPGPAGLITTTTWASLHPENETRMLSLIVRDDREQTQGIFQALADRANGRQKSEPDLAPWHALQTYLEMAGIREVSIPYAHALAAKTNSRAVRLRRDFGKLLSLIQAHAILHQATREKDEQGRILATLDDYRAVHSLVADIFSEGVETSVSPMVREAVQAVDELSKRHDRPVSMLELAKALDIDKSSASRRVRVAIEHGYLMNMEERRGKPARLTVGEPMPDEQPVLPEPDDLYRPIDLDGGSLGRLTIESQEAQQTEGGGIPSRNAATVQQSLPFEPDSQDNLAKAPNSVPVDWVPRVGELVYRQNGFGELVEGPPCRVVGIKDRQGYLYALLEKPGDEPYEWYIRRLIPTGEVIL